MADVRLLEAAVGAGGASDLHHATRDDRIVLERAMAARPDACFWVDDLASGFDLDAATDLDRPLPIGSVLWAMENDAEREACAELALSGWCRAAAARRRLAALARRHAVLGRFWEVDPADVFDELVQLPTPGSVLVVGDLAVARIASVDVDVLEADLNAAGAWLTRRHGVTQVLWWTGAAAALDLCPDPIARAARAAARTAAQAMGEAAGAGEAVTDARWAMTCWRSTLARARADQAFADRIVEHSGAQVAQLARLPMRGPDPSPALPAPAAFVEAWSAADELVCGKDKKVRRRRGERRGASSSVGGRPRALTLARYVRARRAVVARGERLTDPAVRRELAAGGLEVSRGPVLTRRREFEQLDEQALAALDDALRDAGLDAIAATAVPAHRRSSKSVIIPWVGGKGRILDHVIAALPPGRLRLVDPTFGGGALGVELAEQGRLDRPLFADSDADLIHFWRWLQRDPDRVFETASRWAWTRGAFKAIKGSFEDLDGVERAAAFFWLVWRALNGLCRRNGRGRFNMPPGDRVGIGVDLDRLRAVSRALRDATFVVGDAEDVIDGLEGPRVVYIDPPYWPVSKTAGFTAYDGRGFQAGDFVRIVGAARRHAAAGGVAVVSNAANAPVLELCRGADIRWVSAWRSVSCTQGTRGGAHEIIARWGFRTPTMVSISPLR